MKIAHKISLSFFVVAFICGLAVLTFVYSVVADIMSRSITTNLEAVVHARTNHIETYLEMLEISVGQLSKSVVLEDYLNIAGQEGPEQKKAYEIALNRLKRTREANTAVSEFLLLNRNGRVIAATDERSIGSDKSSDAFFVGAQSGVYVKDAYYYPPLKQPLLAVSAPFLDSKTGEFLGVVAARIKLNDLNNIVTDKTGLGDAGEIYIVNKYGYMITPSRFLSDTFLRQKVETEGAKEVRLHKSREHIFPKNKLMNVYPDYRGVWVLGVHDFIPRMHWGVLAEIDEKEAMAPLAKLRLIFYYGLLIAGVMVGVLGMFVAKIISKPIRKLQDGVERIGSGQRDIKLGIDTNDEIGQLSQAFNKMADNLRNSTTSIEVLNREIAEREKVEQALESAEKRYMDVLYASQDAILLISGDKFVDSNAATARMLGYASREAFMMTHPSQLSPPVQPDGRDSFGKANDMMRIAHDRGFHSFDWVHRKANGEDFSVRVSLTPTVIKGKEMLHCTWHDLTRQKLDEQRLRETQQRLVAQTAQLDEALKESRRSSAVLESMLDDNNQVRESLQKAYEDLKNTQNQLVQSEKLASIGQLAAGVAHEINNPVGFISSNLEVMTGYVEAYLQVMGLLEKSRASVEKKEWGAVEAAMAEIERLKETVNFPYMIEDSRRLIEQSRGGMERIRKIVADLKNYAREETQWLEDPVKIEDVVENALAITHNELKYKIELRKDYGATPLVRCNAQKLGQVFVNLLMNAAQAVAEKGVIEVRTYVKGRSVCVDVSDTGCGIPPENLIRVFDPFFTTKPVGKGTGLGLSISYEIVKKQKGELTVVSEVGKGTTFTVMLPLPLVKVDQKT